MSESWMTLQLPPKLDGSPMTPEEEVLFWRYFYTESQRLFGEKEGTLEGLTAKAMSLLKYDVQFFVSRKVGGEPDDVEPEPVNVPVYEYGPPGINKLEQKKAYDAAKRKSWRSMRDPYYLAWVFEVYTNPAYYGHKDEKAKVEYLPGPMSPEEAIQKIKEDLHFQTFGAAHKALFRAGVDVPNTWPK